MPSYRIAICRHHSSEAPDRHEILEAANEQEALLAAVCSALDESIPGIDKYSLPAINNAFRALDQQDEVRLPVMWDCEPYHFLLWNVEDPPGQRQIGIGESDRDWSEPNQYECRWVSVREWQPDPVERERLLALSKEEVVDRLLRLQATSQPIFPSGKVPAHEGVVPR